MHKTSCFGYFFWYHSSRSLWSAVPRFLLSHLSTLVGWFSYTEGMPVGQSAPTHHLCSPLWISALPDDWKHFISLHTLTHYSLSPTSIISLQMQGKVIYSIPHAIYQWFSLFTTRPVPLAFLLLLMHLRKHYIFVHCFLLGLQFFFSPNSYKHLWFSCVSCSIIPASWVVPIQPSNNFHMTLLPYCSSQGPNSDFLVTLTLVSFYFSLHHHQRQVLLLSLSTWFARKLPSAEFNKLPDSVSRPFSPQTPWQFMYLAHSRAQPSTVRLKEGCRFVILKQKQRPLSHHALAQPRSLQGRTAEL